MFQIRELNFARPGAKRMVGDVIVNENMLRCWAECKKLSQFDERRNAVDRFNRLSALCIALLTLGLLWSVRTNTSNEVSR